MRHGRNELGEHVWECTECSYSHKKKTNTFRHVESKHVSCVYLCPMCGQSNTCRNSLKQHLNLKHGVSQSYWNKIVLGNKLLNDPSIEAEVLKKMLATADEMGLKMWQCLDCDYKVKNSNDLRKHVERKHLMCQVFCDICNKVFNCRYRLQQHNRKFHAEIY